MTDETERPGESTGDFRFWSEGGNWFFLPERPSPLRRPDGRPQVGLIEGGGVAMLSVGAGLDPGPAAMERLREAVTRRTGDPAAAARLHPAPLMVRRAVLQLRDGEGFAEVATARPSDTPPQAAAFSAVLREGQAANAKTAMAGERGHLRVLYAVELPHHRSAMARLTGELSGHLPAEGLMSEAAAGEVIRCALASGDARWAEEADPGVSKALREAARAAAMAEAVAGLARMGSAGPGAQALLDSVARRDEAAPLTMELVADVADWVGGA